jgi:CheY-like chemotaxis protein
MQLIGHKILIVEDDEDIREVLRDFFESEGCLVATALNGREALTRLEVGPRPDLIFLDLMMPVMNGEEFVIEMKKTSDWAKIPIVILSADHRAAELANELKIKWCVKKPVALKTLVTMAEEALGA